MTPDRTMGFPLTPKTKTQTPAYCILIDRKKSPSGGYDSAPSRPSLKDKDSSVNGTSATVRPAMSDRRGELENLRHFLAPQAQINVG